MAKKNIYDKQLIYTILRNWSDWAIRFSYRKAEIKEKDKLPKDGALIVCPNHCNTLMDALVMLRAHKKETVFGARADLFRKRFIAKIMYFLRILPMVRQRDGLRNVLQNNKTQEVIVETLKHDVRFCLFPEGTHRTKHSLQPLGKGAFRIALAASEEFGDKKPVYLVPVGIEYGDYFRYHSTSLVNYGEAINVTEFLKSGNFENEPQAIDALRKELTERMKGLITYIPADENYEAKWALVKMAAVYKSRKCYGDFGRSLYKSMLKNREIAERIEEKMEKKPEKMASILERVSSFDAERKAKGISIFSFRKKKPLVNVIMKGLNALIGLPYFLFSAVTSLPMWLASMKIRSIVKDPAFRNTVSFGIKLGLGTILFILYTTLAFCLAPWWLALILILLWIPSYSYFHDYIEACRRWVSDIRLLKNKKLYKEFKSIMKDFA